MVSHSSLLSSLSSSMASHSSSLSSLSSMVSSSHHRIHSSQCSCLITIYLTDKDNLVRVFLYFYISVFRPPDHSLHKKSSSRLRKLPDHHYFCFLVSVLSSSSSLTSSTYLMMSSLSPAASVRSPLIRISVCSLAFASSPGISAFFLTSSFA